VIARRLARTDTRRVIVALLPQRTRASSKVSKFCSIVAT
jgi:hypothetical protein